MIVTQKRHPPTRSYVIVAGLTYAMFFMFAMTTDAVGEIIKLAKTELGLTLTQASAFHWAPMVAIAASGMFLGFLADRLGRKAAIILGLGVYGVASALFMSGRSFELYITLLFASGLAIGVFKTAALALIGDLSSSTQDHTKRMNLVEGFFAVGAIVGPLLVVYLASHGISWTYLYLIAAVLCGLMIAAALVSPYPQTKHSGETPSSPFAAVKLLGNRYALGFSCAIALYVACEVAIFVWLPTFLAGYQGGAIDMWVAAYAVMIFFTLRAIGRFMGIWILNRMRWQTVMALFSGLIFALFLASAVLGKGAALYLLPASGLFMSMIYPTLNSKGISCFPKSAHGAVAGLILFFTAFAAAVGPVLMAYVAETFGGGDMQVGFWLATGFAAALFAGCLWNWRVDPAAGALAAADLTEYAESGARA